jgi:WD repeat-containing protein 42A
MSLFHDLCDRELGVDGRYDPIRFRRNVLSSKFLLERYELKGLLRGHSGCVNTVLFSQDGRHIFTGSDDTNVNIYGTENGELVESFNSVHTNNIFYARDLPGSEMTTILTCAADGRVCVTNLATKAARRLHRHRGRAHRIALVPYQDNQFFSCGEDGVCCLFDLREGVSTLFSEQGSSLSEDVYAPAQKTEFKNNRERVCSIYTVGVNPLFPFEVALAGSSNHIALYDSRRFKDPVSYLCPEKLATSTAHVTGLKYDHTGSILIGSYNDDDVYSFLVKDNALPARRPSGRPGNPTAAHTVDEESFFEEDVRQRGYYRRYTGHRNSNTVKQVSFLGGRSDYVISGSDCGHLFIWDAHTAQTVQLLKADSVGAINCLSAHPVLPILATSGLENDAKVWAPIGEHKPLVEGTDKAKELRNLSARNSDRNSAGAYSNSLLSLLMALLHRGDLPLHMHDSDDEGGAFDELDEEEEEDDDEDGGEEEMSGAEDGESEDGEGQEEDEDGEEGGETWREVGPQPARRRRPAAREGVRRDRWLRRDRPGAGSGGQTSVPVAAEGTTSVEGSPAEESIPLPREAGSEEGDSSGDDGDAAYTSSGSGGEEGNETESEEESDPDGETVSMADLATGRVGLMVDGVPVPWSELARFLPALLGRRRRTDSDTGDEAKAEDEQEQPHHHVHGSHVESPPLQGVGAGGSGSGGSQPSHDGEGEGGSRG